MGGLIVVGSLVFLADLAGLGTVTDGESRLATLLANLSSCAFIKSDGCVFVAVCFSVFEFQPNDVPFLAGDTCEGRRLKKKKS